MNLWDEAAELLERGDAYPSDDIDAEVRKLIRERHWPQVGAVLLNTHRELSHGRSTQAEDVAWAAGLIPILRPQGWEQAPKGEALEQAILAAYRGDPVHG
ncbi:MAG: hypothetical protein ACYCX9_10775 [Candidatus Dormibacteria bacterium]